MKVQVYKTKESAQRYANELKATYPALHFEPEFYDWNRWAVGVTYPDGSRALVGLRRNWKVLNYHKMQARRKA